MICLIIIILYRIKMQEIQNLLNKANLSFDKALKLINGEKQQSVEENNNKEPVNEQLNQEDLLEIDFQADQTIQYFIRPLPQSIFNQEIYEEVEKLKTRQIPVQRKIQVFAGFLDNQKKGLDRLKSEVKQQENIVPQGFQGSANYKLKFNDKQQIFCLKSDQLAKLNPNEDLNDTIISNYFNLLKLYVFPSEIQPKVYVYSTFFMCQLMGELLYRQQFQQMKLVDKKLMEASKRIIKQNYSKVKNWTKKIDLFKMQYLIIPMNPNNHWNSIIVVNPGSVLVGDQRCQIIGIDSMFQIRPIFFDVIKYYLEIKADQNEQKTKINIQQIKASQILVPRQTNHHDCGLYLLCYIEVFFSKESNLRELVDDDKNFLKKFPRSLFLSMRASLKNLFYRLMKSQQEKSEKTNEIITKYFKNRQRIALESKDFDEIDMIQLQKYKHLTPNLQQESEQKAVLRFYLDCQINYYERLP